MKQTRCCGAESAAKQGAVAGLLSSVPATFAVKQNLIRPCAEPGCSLGSCTRAAEVRIWPRSFFLCPASTTLVTKTLTTARTALTRAWLPCWQRSRSLCHTPLTRSTFAFHQGTEREMRPALGLSASKKGKEFFITRPCRSPANHGLTAEGSAVLSPSSRAVAGVLLPDASRQVKGKALAPVCRSFRHEEAFSIQHRAHRDPNQGCPPEREDQHCPTGLSPRAHTSLQPGRWNNEPWALLKGT